jgi:hypothetical protein
MNRKLALFLCGFILCAEQAYAQEAVSFSGQVSQEGGIAQNASSSIQPYQNSRLFLQSHGEFDPEFSWGLEGEVDQQSSGIGLVPVWITYAKQNYVNLEADNSNLLSSTSYQMARLDRAFFKWISGRLEISAGLQSFGGGTAYFYQPTHYFDPLPALGWVTDEPLGSEGLQADCFLFDDLSVEGEVRYLVDGSSEWVARLVNKGIGIAITPSFAWLNGRNGAGLELSGTFPDFQVRFDGVNWFYSDGRAQMEWVAGVSGLIQGTKFTLEGLQDTTGDALGGWTMDNPNAFYLFASAQRDFSGQWQANPALVKSLNGGPLLIWPKLSWNWNRDWKLTEQAQWPLGATDGALGLYPSRTGLSLAFLF